MANEVLPTNDGGPTDDAVRILRSTIEELRHSEERFRLLVETVQDYAIFMLDPSGVVATWNEGAKRIKRYEEREIVGKHFSVFYPKVDVDAGRCEMALDVASKTGRFEDEGWRIRKDGTTFWANVVITALRSSTGALVGFSKVTRDLTDRRHLEEERVQRAQAEEAIRLRDEFLAIAAHELRTPLTTLNLGLQGLLRTLSGSDDEGVRGKIARAVRAGDRLKELIESLLDVSRIASGNFSLAYEATDLAALVAGAVDAMHPAADQAATTVTVNAVPVTAVVDRVRINQIVTNLVGNALKYGRGSPVEVSVRGDGDEALIEVRDGGRGIPEADLERIFGRFERAVPVRHFGGLGLGLYVTREIAMAHGGSVAAKNVEGGGALLTVRLPLDPTSARKEHA